MSAIIEWLESYNTEYDVANKILRIRKPIAVKDFVALKKILEPYKHRIDEIIVEG